MLGMTPKEAEICQYLAQGLPRKVIWDRLGISYHTLDIHLARIRKKCRRETTQQTCVFLANLSLASS